MPTGIRRLAASVLAGLALSLGGAGCAFGPNAIESTHGRYASAIQRVDEEQFLTNIVRLRYMETPRELAVASVATQYELSTSVEARPFFSTEAARFANPSVYGVFSQILPFAGINGSNRPTVSMTPQNDGTSMRQYLTPISADTLVFLGQSGWPMSHLLRIWVDRLNGVPNWVPPSAPPTDAPADFERFERACELLQVAQYRELLSIRTESRASEVSGPLPPAAVTAAAVVDAAKEGFEFRPTGDGKSWALVKPERRLVLQVNQAGQGSPELAELAQLLNLKPGSSTYELTLASGVPDPAKNKVEPAATLRLTPRSTAQALFFLANGVEVPLDHVQRGLVRLPPDGTDPSAATRGVFRVHSCRGHKHLPPKCAFVAVWHRDHWFYIDDRDLDSKATLLLMLQLRRLDFKRQEIGGVPALTLPVGR